MRLSVATHTFLQDGRYTRAWSPETVTSYEITFRRFQAIVGDVAVESLTKASLTAFIVALREKGLASSAVNVRLRAGSCLRTTSRP